MEEKKKSTSVLRISLLSLGMSGMLLAGPDVVQGQIYKWVDAEGRIHFSDSPIGKADVVDEELPPTSQFISPRPPTPPTPPEQTEAEEDTQDAEDAASPTTQTTDQAAEEEIGGVGGRGETNWDVGGSSSSTTSASPIGESEK